MRTLLTVGFVSLGLVLGSAPALATGKHYRSYNYGHHGGHSYGYRHHGHNRHHHGYNDDVADAIIIGAGILGGSILLGSVLSQPQYAPPPQRYYAPPRAPVCEQDDVYRYLPDGRIQWGVRTRCY